MEKNGAPVLRNNRKKGKSKSKAANKRTSKKGNDKVGKGKANSNTSKKPAPKQSKKVLKPIIFSESTDYGLAVTLKATLELAEFLCSKCSYSYLMTARLNQDCLESFFGMMRGAGGGNTLPEPTTFAQLFRLLSVYSLIKPPKGSNITGGNLLSSLLKTKDIHTATKEERKKMFEESLDKIILQGENYDDLAGILEEADEQSYIDCPIDNFIHNYISGFMARHSQRYLKNECYDCKGFLMKDASSANEADLLITLKSKGFLTYPSEHLVATLKVVEEAIITVSKVTGRHKNILFMILDKLNSIQVPHVGCPEHSNDLTKKIVKSYLIMRMYFLSDRWNRELAEQKQKQRNFRKQAHLT